MGNMTKVDGVDQGGVGVFVERWKRKRLDRTRADDGRDPLVAERPWRSGTVAGATLVLTSLCSSSFFLITPSPVS